MFDGRLNTKGENLMAQEVDARSRMDGETARSRVDWARALLAGLVATVIITISMGLFGMNIMKSLGSMMLGPASSVSTQYVVGGLIHLMVGVGYGLVYAAVLAPVRRWPAILKGVVFGLAITAIALAAMPVMGAMMSRGGAANPCNPCGGQASASQANPCNPCAAKSASAPQTNPCNPCAAKNANQTSAPQTNPCNPCAVKNANQTSGESKPPNPCNPCTPKNTSKASAGANPCNVAGAGNPCNPCGGGGANPYSGLVSLINHVIFGLVLALVYGRGATSHA
jgi:hypothetical protein